MHYEPPNYNRDFKERVAIVTGASSGIGKAVAEALSYHGAHVCNLDKKDLGTVETYVVDVSKPSQIKRVVEQIVSKHGVPEILVNNAGVENNRLGNLVTMPSAEMHNIVNTNLMGYVNMIREVIPHMEKNGYGRIVNISSVQATQSCLPGTIYQITKQGILGIARVMTLEYASKNIRINTVSPGGIRTEGMGNARADDPHALDDLLRSTPLQRRGHPQEIANAVLFFLSEAASYIHGQEIIVDGGLTSTLLGDVKLPQHAVPNDPDSERFKSSI